MISKQRVMEWIELQLTFEDGRASRPCHAGLAAALAYLKEPLMPAEPSDEMIRSMAANCTTPRTMYQLMRTKLLEPPKPKTRTVFCVAWREDNAAHVAEYWTAHGAQERRDLLRNTAGRTHISEVYEATVPMVPS